MTDRARVFVVTGDDVLRFSLGDATVRESGSLLYGVGARCVAADPHDP